MTLPKDQKIKDENIESINVVLSSALLDEIEKIHQEIPDPST